MTDERVIDASRVFMQTAQRLPSIFDLDDQLCAILALVEDAEASGQEVADGLQAQLALVETALAQKVEGYVSVIRSLEHIRDARKAEADRLRARAQTADRAVDWLKGRLKVHMESTGQQRIETPRFSVSLSKSPPRVEVLEMQMLPLEFKRTKVIVEPDKTAIRDHWKKTGEIVAGCEIVRGEHVVIS